MDKTRSTIQLLALISIYFIYKAIMGIFTNNSIEVMLWSIITLVYIISLIILYFVIKKWESEKTI
ncbi:MAG: hypothetical protein ACFE88_15085 [Candidatus Hermodarchaeota archaeon]